MTTKNYDRVRIAVYFKGNMKSYERLENLTKHTGLKLSRVAMMAINYGVTALEEKLLEPEQLIDKDKAKKK